MQNFNARGTSCHASSRRDVTLQRDATDTHVSRATMSEMATSDLGTSPMLIELICYVFNLVVIASVAYWMRCSLQKSTRQLFADVKSFNASLAVLENILEEEEKELELLHDGALAMRRAHHLSPMVARNRTNS